MSISATELAIEQLEAQRLRAVEIYRRTKYTMEAVEIASRAVKAHLRGCGCEGSCEVSERLIRAWRILEAREVGAPPWRHGGNERHNPNGSRYDPFDETQHGLGGTCWCRYCMSDHRFGHA